MTQRSIQKAPEITERKFNIIVLETSRVLAFFESEWFIKRILIEQASDKYLNNVNRTNKWKLKTSNGLCILLYWIPMYELWRVPNPQVVNYFETKSMLYTEQKLFKILLRKIRMQWFITVWIKNTYKKLVIATFFSSSKKYFVTWWPNSKQQSQIFHTHNTISATESHFLSRSF